jgi:hypothetical protein
MLGCAMLQLGTDSTTTTLMGSRVIRGLLVLVAFVALAEPRAAEACSCGMVESPGAALTRAETVFVGTVGEIKKIEGDRHETTFAVSEVFRGQPGATIVVASRWNGGTCDAGPFKTGERMLIYAGGRGPLYVSGCSGSKRLDQAAADLAYLRRSKTAGIATIEGTIMTPDPGDDDHLKPRVNVEIRARGTKHATRTGADGTYRLELPPGTYQLDVVDPDPSFSSIHTTQAIALPVAGTWARHDFNVSWNGRLRGRLLDHAGQPAANVLVRLLDAESSEPLGRFGVYGPAARTDAGGNYEISRVPEGRYQVAVSVPFDTALPVPATYYPGVPTRGQARTVELSRANPLAVNVDFTLRAPQRVFTITGVVVRARKTESYPNARVTLLNKTDRRTAETYAIGFDSKFEFKEVEGAALKIYACDGASGDGDCGDPIAFTLDRDRAITLVLPQ